MKKQLLVASLLALGVLMGATACAGSASSSPEPQETELTLNKDDVALEINGKYQLSVDYEGEETLIWSVSDSTIVSVENGKLIGLKAGTATVTVTAGDCTDSCTITVSGYNESKLSLKLAKANLTLYKDATKQIEATVAYNGVTITPTVEKNYTSTNAEIVSVDENGLLTAKALGNATISVVYTLGETELSSSVNVTVVSTGKVIIDQEYVELDVSEANKTATLTAKAYEEGAQNANAEIIWSATEGQDVVSIDGATIRAVNAGETTVTATYVDKSGIAQTDAITVTVDSITIDSEKSLSLMKDDYPEGYAPNTQELFGTADAIIGGYVLSEDGWQADLPYANGKYDISELALGTMDFYVQTRNVSYKVSLELGERIYLNNENFKSKLLRAPESETLKNYYILDEDIVLDAGWWKNSAVFNGTLDGNGHKITVLKCQAYTADAGNGGGLFHKTVNATFKNLIIKDVMLAENAAAFAYTNEGTTTFENVYVSVANRGFGSGTLTGDETFVDKGNVNKAGFICNNTVEGSQLVLNDCVVYFPEHLTKLSGFVAATSKANAITVNNCTFIGGNGKLVGGTATVDVINNNSVVLDAVAAHKALNEKATLTNAEKTYQVNHPYVELKANNFAKKFPNLTCEIVVLKEDVVLDNTYLGKNDEITFTGVLDGNGKTISGINVSGAAKGGLFYTLDGSVKNLALKGKVSARNSGIIAYNLNNHVYLENVYVETTVAVNDYAAPIAYRLNSQYGTLSMKNVTLLSTVEDGITWNSADGHAAVVAISRKKAIPVTMVFENCYYIAPKGATAMSDKSTTATVLDHSTGGENFFYDGCGMTGYNDYNTFYDAAYNSLNATMQGFLPAKSE